MSNIAINFSIFIREIKKRLTSSLEAQSSNNDNDFILNFIDNLEQFSKTEDDLDVPFEMLSELSIQSCQIDNQVIAEYAVNNIKPFCNAELDFRHNLLRECISFIYHCSVIHDLSLLRQLTSSAALSQFFQKLFPEVEDMLLFIQQHKIHELIAPIHNSKIFSQGELHLELSHRQMRLEKKWFDIGTARESIAPKRVTSTQAAKFTMTPEAKKRFELLARYGKTSQSAPSSPHKLLITPSPRANSAPTTPKDSEMGVDRLATLLLEVSLNSETVSSANPSTSTPPVIPMLELATTRADTNESVLIRQRETKSDKLKKGKRKN